MDDFSMIEDIVDVVGRFRSFKPDSISCDKKSTINIVKINLLSDQCGIHNPKEIDELKRSMVEALRFIGYRCKE